MSCEDNKFKLGWHSVERIPPPWPLMSQNYYIEQKPCKTYTPMRSTGVPSENGNPNHTPTNK